MSLITFATRVHFGDGILEDGLRSELAALGVRRPLLITDTGVSRAGLLERIFDGLPRDCFAVTYDGTPANPSEGDTDASLAAYRDHDCDGIIGFGGGSVLDLAKITGLRISHPGPLAHYATIEGGSARIKAPLPPMIAIPTTAGTGSEVGRSASIVIGDGRKLGITSSEMVPRVAICDPTLTVPLDPQVTAATGMGAVAQCIESFIATAYNPPADGIALDGLRRAACNLVRAVETGRNLDARREMMAAAMNGALAAQKGLGAVQALSHALAAVGGRRLHHGTLSAILLPYVLDYNGPAVADRYGLIRQVMGLGTGSDLAGEIDQLNMRIGLPRRLSELGLDVAAIEAAAPLAEADAASTTNPRRIGAGDYLEIMDAAL